MRPLLLGTSFALCCYWASAHAQDSYLGGAYIDAGIGNAGIQAAMQGTENQVFRSHRPVKNLQPVKLAYSTSSARRKANLATFVEKARKTDAADPAPDAPEKTLAANDRAEPAAPPTSSSPPPVVRRLGGVFLLGKMAGRSLEYDRV